MIRINLLADRHAKDRLAIQEQILLGMITLAATFVLCFFWWQMKSLQISQTNDKITTAQKELEKQKKIRQQVADMQKRQDKVKAILKAIDTLLTVKRGPTIYFDNLNVILPPEIWVTRLVDNNGNISLNGYSFSNNAIAQLMRNIDKSEHFVNVDLQGIDKARFGQEVLKKFSLRFMTTLGQKIQEEKKKLEAAKKKAAQKGKKKKKSKKKKSGH